MASCPRCVGVGGYETAPDDWHDCEVCDATGMVDLLTLFRYQSEKDSEVNMARPSWDNYFLDVACLVASRSTCLRRNVGCVLVQDRRVIATGYNGAPTNAPHCSEVGCLRAALDVPSGDRLDICRASHAEANAIAQCAHFGIASAGAIAYVTVSPCASCARLLVQAGVVRIVCAGEYPDERAYAVLRDAGVKLVTIGSEGEEV